jgi:hypothetical protein
MLNIECVNCYKDANRYMDDTNEEFRISFSSFLVLGFLFSSHWGKKSAAHGFIEYSFIDQPGTIGGKKLKH